MAALVQDTLTKAWNMLIAKRVRNADMQRRVSVARLSDGKEIGRDAYVAEFLCHKNKKVFRPFLPHPVRQGGCTRKHFAWRTLRTKFHSRGNFLSLLTPSAGTSPVTPVDIPAAAGRVVVIDDDDNTLPSSYTPSPAPKGKGNAPCMVLSYHLRFKSNYSF